MNQFKRRRLHYGWIVVAVAGAAVLIGPGVGSAPGIFRIAMEEDIGISRSSAGAVAVAAGVASLSIKRNQRPVVLAAT